MRSETHRDDGDAPDVALPGRLAHGWRLTVLTAWIAVTVGLAAAWAASRQIGLSTWWLRPGSPQVVRLVPFIAPVAMIGLVLAHRPRLWRLGMVAGLATVAVGIGDLGRVTGLALVEMLLGACGVAVSAAAWTGTYREPGR